MTDSAVDKMVSDDLHELGAMHGHPRVALANPFRALARTSTDLRRFVDLASAVHVWRPVYAHRVARAVTGAAAVIAALLLADFLRDPRSLVEPVWNIGGSLVLLATIYRVARAIGRRRFERAARARRVAVPSEGANDDAWALEAVARVDPWATSFTVAGLTMLLLAFGLVLGGDTRLGDLDGPRVSAVIIGHHLATTAALGSVVAVALGAVVHRARRGLPLPRWARLLEHGTTLAIGVAVTCAALLLASPYTIGLGEDVQPSDVDRIMHAAELGMVLVASWVALRLRRRESARAHRASS